MYCSGYFNFFVSEDVLEILYDAKSQTVLFFGMMNTKRNYLFVLTI